jgi:hypothetical protein
MGHPMLGAPRVGLLRQNRIVPSDDVDPKRVRLGLAMVSLVFLVSLALAALVDDPLGRAVMAAIALSAILRAVLLARSVRRVTRPSGPGVAGADPPSGRVRRRVLFVDGR